MGDSPGPSGGPKYPTSFPLRFVSAPQTDNSKKSSAGVADELTVLLDSADSAERMRA